jgi:hypothetical protein
MFSIIDDDSDWFEFVVVGSGGTLMIWLIILHFAIL